MRFLWAVQGTPCGRLLAAALPDLVPRLRRLGELDIDDVTAGELLKIAPATIDRRLALKPGLTGLWQVEGRSNLSWAEALQLDLYYVETWSLSGDLVLLARTVRAVIQGRGAL